MGRAAKTGTARSGLPFNTGDRDAGTNEPIHRISNPPLVRVAAGKCESCGGMIDSTGQCRCSD